MKRSAYLPLLLLGCVAFTSCEHPSPDQSGSPDQSTQSPYAGQETRQVKALSDDRVEGLLAGEGLGYAKVAELNGFAGPKHVLELASELELTESQRNETKRVMTRMHDSATRLGRELVETEQVLDSQFASDGTVDSASVLETMLRAGNLEAQIRWVHVRAHLQQNEILNTHQRRRYVELRGYGKGGDHEHDPAHQHEHSM